MNAINTIEKPVNQMLGQLKVLLAEDNEVNQLLAKSILQYWGLETKIAVTGFQVMDLMEKEDFDVVLMDIQMPEKSGIEAAQEIRNMLCPKKRNTPIIALTANALKGEELKYKAVGMDDFLTKPFKENDLYEVIDRVMKKEGSFGRVQSDVQVEVVQKEAPLYDMDQLFDMSGGNKDFILSLVKIFIDTVPVNSREMAQAAEEGNWEMVSKLAHKLKSTIDTMRIVSLKEDIRTIELDAKKKLNLPYLKVLIEKVQAVIGKVTNQLQKEFSV